MEELCDLIPDGVKDTYYKEYEVKENIISRIKNVFKSFGYKQISTPGFEYYDLFAGTEGTIDKDEMFKFIDGNGRILVLRPDMTVPIARMAAVNFRKCEEQLRFSYVSNVFRNSCDRGYSKKEFTQAGIEHFGSSKSDSDAEAIAVGIKSLIGCGIKDIRIDMGNVGFFRGLKKEYEIPEKEWTRIQKLIENKNYDELSILLDKLNLPTGFKKNLLDIPFLYGKPEYVIQKAKKLIQNDEMEKSLNNLEMIYKILKDYGYDDYVYFDLGLLNHLQYYTGAIFKGYINNYGREIISGGRYDNLTKQYGRIIPAVGFGLNIDELMEVINMNSENLTSEYDGDYLILYTEKTRHEALTLASRLRDYDFIVVTDYYLESFKTPEFMTREKNFREIIYIDNEHLEIRNVDNNAAYKCTMEKFIDHIHSDVILSSIH